MPQTAYMKDLDQIGVMAKAEMGFIKMIVSPLWSLINMFLDNELENLIVNLNKNAEKWEQIYLENTNDTEKKSFLFTIFQNEDQSSEQNSEISGGAIYKRSKSLFSNLKRSSLKSQSPEKSAKNIKF